MKESGARIQEPGSYIVSRESYLVKKKLGARIQESEVLPVLYISRVAYRVKRIAISSNCTLIKMTGRPEDW